MDVTLHVNSVCPSNFVVAFPPHAMAKREITIHNKLILIFILIRFSVTMCPYLL